MSTLDDEIEAVEAGADAAKPEEDRLARTPGPGPGDSGPGASGPDASGPDDMAARARIAPTAARHTDPGLPDIRPAVCGAW